MDRNVQGGLSAVACGICERDCKLRPGRTGACGMYELRDGQVCEVLSDHYLVVCPISIETMPLLHYHPGHRFLQISTTGCNFDCPGCVSTVIVREMPRHSKALMRLAPVEVINRALDENCLGITFLMNDPLASLPSFLRVARLAKETGLKVGCSTNAYFTSQSLEKLLPLLDFVNVGIKGYSDRAYRACGAAPGIAPVLRNLESLVNAGVHVEVSVMYGMDGEDELRGLAQRIAAISPLVPLQLMRFIPFEGADPALEPSVRRAEEFCRQLRGSLRHVYLFNTPGTDLLDTTCPDCGRSTLRREFYGPMGAKLLGGPEAGETMAVCPSCGAGLDVQGTASPGAHQEGDFQGGYPFTRALEMVEAMLIAIGVRRKREIVRAWEHLLEPGGLKRLHQGVQQPAKYIELVRHFGRVVGAEEQAEDLAGYLEQKLDMIAADLDGIEHRPGVYYAMAKPLFYLGGGRLENQLAEYAGGVSLNKLLPPGGRPGRRLTVQRLNELDPEHIFISAFLSNTAEDFLAECRELDVEARAVKLGQIHAHPAPGWDFGSPRWILGLMYMANALHPRRCAYDVMAEAQEFYQRFYEMDFSPQHVTRSFAKPSGNWSWQGRGDDASLTPPKSPLN